MIVLKILAAPFVVALTLIVAIVSFLYCVASALCHIGCVVLTLLTLVLFIGGQTQGGELISSYECDYKTAVAEFLLSKAKYKAATGREQQRDADVLCYQIRQSFKPGEITPEEANRAATKRRCGQAGAWWCDLVPCARAATAPRLRSSTLGAGFDPGEIRDVIAGKRPLPKLDAPAPAAPRRVDLIVDI